MDQETVSKLTQRFEQMEYLLENILRDIEEGKSQSAQIGICLALEVLEKIREEIRLKG